MLLLLLQLLLLLLPLVLLLVAAPVVAQTGISTPLQMKRGMKEKAYVVARAALLALGALTD